MKYLVVPVRNVASKSQEDDLLDDVRACAVLPSWAWMYEDLKNACVLDGDAIVEALRTKGSES